MTLCNHIDARWSTRPLRTVRSLDNCVATGLIQEPQKTSGTSEQLPGYGRLRFWFGETRMSQLSFASLAFAGKKKRTKRDIFLAEMNEARALG
jgi:hypothetical protein